MTAPKFEALNAPPDCIEKGGVEVLRASVVDGAVSIAMRRSFDDPFTWGVLLADLAKHAARIYALETELTEEQALLLIQDGIESEFQNMDDDGHSQTH